MNLKEDIKKYKNIVDIELERLLSLENIPQKTVLESMRYSIFAGGKRLRPILAIKACELFNGNIDDVITFASAIEMIHTYSLIHDDLPAMDDDNYRRGKLTNHKVYGEAIAMLAGDGLLNLAYETMIQKIIDAPDLNERYQKAFKVVAKSAGVYGMIGGQVVDILSNDKKISKETLDFIHSMKTSALIESSILSGALIGGANEDDILKLTEFGKTIGMLFQIRDDILDKIGEAEKLGKDIGSDEENNKTTYVTFYGLEDAIKLSKELYEYALTLLEEFNTDKVLFFYELTKYLLHRES